MRPMVVRKRRKVRKLRGSRVYGFGRVSGGHRKSGQRGGKGKSGKKDHHWIKTVKMGQIKIKGFTRPPAARSPSLTVNVGELSSNADLLVTAELAEATGDSIKIDVESLGYDKVLGKGQVRNELIVSAPAFSDKARAKIEAAGGSCIIPEDGS